MTTMAVALCIASLSAQTKPNFSGKWVRDDAAAAGGAMMSGGGAGNGFGCGMTCTITQDATTLKVGRAQGDQTITSTFKLDGTESKNQGFGRGGTTEVITVAKWDGNKLTFTTNRDMQGGRTTFFQTISMEGPNMVVETSANMGQVAQRPQKVTYKKQ